MKPMVLNQFKSTFSFTSFSLKNFILFLVLNFSDSGYVHSNNELIEYDTDTSIFIPNSFGNTNFSSTNDNYPNDQSIMKEIGNYSPIIKSKKQKMFKKSSTIKSNVRIFVLLRLYCEMNRIK
jgi:hypothetical protein